MLKMMKYEYRRGLFPLLVVGAALMAAELLFLGGMLFKKDIPAGLGIVGLVFGSWAAYMFVLIYGVVIYSKDLKDKSGYMVFMTPLSSYKILDAKLLTIFLTGITLVAFIGLLFVIDYNVMNAYRPGFVTFREMLEGFLGAASIKSLSVIIMNIVVLILVGLLQFFTMICLAYFAVSLASTVLQNKKIKGGISFVLFGILYGLMNYVAYKLPTLGGGLTDAVTFMETVYAVLPQLLLYVVCMVAAYVGSAVLLEKKISL